MGYLTSYPAGSQCERDLPASVRPVCRSFFPDWEYRRASWDQKKLRLEGIAHRKPLEFLLARRLPTPWRERNGRPFVFIVAA